MKFPRFAIVAFFVLLSAKLASAADAPTFALAPGEITSASIQMDSAGHTRLSVTFIPQKRAEFTKFTTANIGNKIKFVVNGKLTSEPIIRSAITGPSMEFTVPSPEAAVEIAKALLKRG